MPRKPTNTSERGSVAASRGQRVTQKRKETKEKRTTKRPTRTTSRPPAAIDEGDGSDSESASDAAGNGVFEVEAILDKKDGDPVKYLVEWKGYAADEATWEAASHLDCPDLVRTFEQRRALMTAQERLGEETTTKRSTKRPIRATSRPPAAVDEGDGSDSESASDAAGNGVFEVEAILDKKDGDPVKYLVKWKGYAADEATWEAASHLDCPDLVRTFEQRRAPLAVVPMLEVQRDSLSVEPADNHFEIEAILEKQMSAGGQATYKIRYKDFPEGEDTAWEAPEHVPMDMIQDFEEAQERNNGPVRGRAQPKPSKRQRDDSDREEEGGVISDRDDPDYEEGEDAKNDDDVADPPRSKKCPSATKQPTLSKPKVEDAPKPKMRKTPTPNESKPAQQAKGKFFGLDRVYIGKKVAFSPATESWMAKKVYGKVGSTFLVGVICNYKYAAKEGKYEVRWLNSYFNTHKEHIDINTVLRGRDNFDRIQGSEETARYTHIFGPTRRSETANVLQLVDDLDDLKEYEFSVPHVVPTTLKEVEEMMDVVFDPAARMRAPAGLFRREDGSTLTQIKPEWRGLFEHSATSSFFAYLPLYFWKQVLEETNAQGAEYAKSVRSKSSNPPPAGKTQRSSNFVPFSLDELMKFLGIMWFMSLVDKGEYSNYWGEQVEDAIFETTRMPLDSIMTLRRFKELRKAFSFRRSSGVTQGDLQRDAAVRVRPILNMLRQTGSKYIDVGRDIAIDEASVSARSKYARHIIVFNASKPTGKYHFKLYMTCCSTTWIALTFRLHCESTLDDRSGGVYDPSSTEQLAMEMKASSAVRQIVLEITRPFYKTGRIVNCDNFYTSVQLAQALRLKGLYCRGTIKRGSRHFPNHVILSDPLQAVKDANKNSTKRPKRSKVSGEDCDGDDGGEETKDGEAEDDKRKDPGEDLDGDDKEEETKNGEVEDGVAPVDPFAVRQADKHTREEGQARAGNDVRRGDCVQAVSTEHNLLAASWCDNTIVSIISNADASTFSTPCESKGSLTPSAHVHQRIQQAHARSRSK